MSLLVRCWIASDQSSHEGSGGGFSVIRFYHLHVENRSDRRVQSAHIPYRLMSGKACFQEDVLGVEGVEPGATIRSKSFIRESQLFDRIEWGGEVEVKADPPIPREAISFRPAGPGSLSRLWFMLGVGLILAMGLWLVLKS